MKWGEWVGGHHQSIWLGCRQLRQTCGPPFTHLSQRHVQPLPCLVFARAVANSRKKATNMMSFRAVPPITRAGECTNRIAGGVAAWLEISRLPAGPVQAGSAASTGSPCPSAGEPAAGLGSSLLDQAPNAHRHYCLPSPHCNTRGPDRS